MHFEATAREQFLGRRINVNGETKQRLGLRALGKEVLKQDLTRGCLVVFGAFELFPTLSKKRKEKLR